MRHTRLATAVTTALTTLVVGGTLLAPSAGAAVPTVDLEPQQLTRGADIAVPHIDEGDFVDGSRRVELPGTVARVIGQVGDGWLVGTSNVDRKRNRRVVRVEADGAVEVMLSDIDTSTVILSADGSTLAWQRFVNGGRKTITYAYSVADEAVVGTMGPRSPVDLLDVAADRVILSGSSRVPLREIDGTRLASYTTGWFSGWEWESPSALLLDVNGRRKFATVRCTLAACENATDPVPTMSPRRS